MQGFISCVTIFALCLLQQTNGYSCFRDPLMLKPRCGCPDLDTCGVINCPNTCSTNSYKPAGCFSTYDYPAYSFCDCGLPCCSSFRDTSNVCFVYDNPTPIFSCLKAVSDYECGCEEMRSFIYFPEVEYPVTVLEMKPFYYATCFSY